MFSAVRATNKAMFGDQVHIGIALDRSNYSRSVMNYIANNRNGSDSSQGSQGGSAFDFIDTHLYNPTPSLLPWNIHKNTSSGDGGESLETVLKMAGLDSNTRLQIGEWSRTIP